MTSLESLPSERPDDLLQVLSLALWVAFFVPLVAVLGTVWLLWNSSYLVVLVAFASFLVLPLPLLFGGAVVTGAALEQIPRAAARRCWIALVRIPA